MIGFAGIIYIISKSFSSQCSSGYTYNNDVKKCVKICNDGEKYYPSVDKCLKCPPGQIQNKKCNNGCQQECKSNESLCGCLCMDHEQYSCIDEIPCPKEKICDGKCCDLNSRCFLNKCVKCSISDTICNGQCCADGQVCSKNGCCDSNRVCEDGSCCNNECCGGVCCGDKMGCVNGKCKTKCGFDEKGNTKYCDPNTEDCVTDVKYNGKNVNLCVKKGCEWDTLIYNPLNVDNAGVFSKTCAAGSNVITCRNPSSIIPPFVKSVVTNQSPTSSSNCNADNCIQRIAEEGIIGITYDESTRKCSGNFDCNSYLGDCGVCPHEYNYPSSCCRDSTGKYTGQICETDQSCINGKCYNQWKCLSKTPTVKICVLPDGKNNPDDDINLNLKKDCDNGCKTMYEFTKDGCKVSENGNMDIFQCSDMEKNAVHAITWGIIGYDGRKRSNLCECRYVPEEDKMEPLSQSITGKMFNNTCENINGRENIGKCADDHTCSCNV